MKKSLLVHTDGVLSAENASFCQLLLGKCLPLAFFLKS